MRMKIFPSLGILTIVSLAAGVWYAHLLLAEDKSARDGPLDKFVYPGAKLYSNEKGIASAQIADFTTEDDPDKVIKWYADRIPRLTAMDLPHGVGSDGGGVPYRETVAAIHDSRRTGTKEKTARPVEVWIATARVYTDNVEEYTLVVVVTRGKDEARTHVALSRLAGPPKGKK